MVVQTGRPRLDHSEDFRRAFATVLPHLRAGDISQGKAAKELGISVRSLKRYVARASSGVLGVVTSKISRGH